MESKKVDENFWREPWIRRARRGPCRGEDIATRRMRRTALWAACAYGTEQGNCNKSAERTPVRRGKQGENDEGFLSEEVGMRG